MKHESLFSGIGGFDYAAEMMGWTNVFHCEIEPFPRKILNYYWPKAISYEDIKTTDFSVEKQKVYLAGGFKSDWANEVKKCSNNFQWINPKDKEFKNGERVVMNVNEYGKWDLHFIKQCDILFVYVQRTNTSCIGLCCEAGFAKGLGKTVITVLEPNHETIKDAYLSFITQVSDIVFETLEDGVEYLKSFGI